MSDPFSLSRIMRPSDYEVLKPELASVDACLARVHPPHPAQHPARRWEVAMAWRAIRKLKEKNEFVPADGNRRFLFSDWGCGVGLLPALCAASDIDVDCYEPWAWGDERSFFHRQFEQVLAPISPGKHGRYSLSTHGLGDRPFIVDGIYDASFCISTMEHIPDIETSFRYFCESVREGGLLFLTVDFSGREIPDDQFIAANVRPNGMPRATTLEQWRKWAADYGFVCFGGPPEWDNWTPECEMVNNYGFASLAMRRL